MGRDITAHIEYKYPDEFVFTHFCSPYLGRNSSFFYELDIREHSNRGVPEDISYDTAADLVVKNAPSTMNFGDCPPLYLIRDSTTNVEYWEVDKILSTWTSALKPYKGDYKCLKSGPGLYDKPYVSYPSWVNSKELEAVHARYVCNNQAEYPHILAVINMLKSFEENDLEARMVYWYDQ